MKCKWLGAALLGLLGMVVGCEDGGTKPKPEELQPDFGQKSGDQLKNMIGVPGTGGKMQPAKPAAK